MTLKKRGLGRGLEALLADDSAKEEKHQSQAMQSGEYQPAKDVGQDEYRLCLRLSTNAWMQAELPRK